MATILKEGCVVTCGYCRTQFSFNLGEVSHSIRPIPAGYSPEEEAYDKSVYTVSCPKCHRGVDVEKDLGHDGKASIRAAAKRDTYREDHDL